MTTPSFNVLTEPWIPVETLDGARADMGIREALARAHELRGITAENPLNEFAIARLLITFLMDAYRPERWDDLVRLVECGRFDGELLSAYIARCGQCFDLFDAERPFMQIPFSESETDVTSAAVLFPEWPVGNNHIMFNHALEARHAFSPAQCARALCGAPLYTTRYSNKKGKGVTGIPPIFFLYAGDTLFETLAMSMIPHSAQPQMDFDDPPVIWRDAPAHADFAPCAKVSLLHGLLSRPLDVQLMPETNQSGQVVVRSIRYGRGWDYSQVVNWRDPHVSQNNEGKLLMGKDERAVWRDLGAVFNEDAQPVWTKDIHKRMRKLKSQRVDVPVHAYVPIARFKSTAFYLTGWFDEPLNVNISLFNEAEKAALLKNALEIMEMIGNRLLRVFSWTVKQIETGQKDERAPDEMLRALSSSAHIIYLNDCRAFLFNEWIPLLSRAEVGFEWNIELMRAAGARFKQTALAAFNTVLNAQAMTAYLLKWRALAQPFLRAQINKQLVKGGWMNDESNERNRASAR